MYALRVETLPIRHIKHGQQKVAADVGRTRSSGNTKLIATTRDLNAEAFFYLSKVFIKLTAQIRQAVIVGGLENNVPRNLDSIQNLYLTPLRKKLSARKADAMPCTTNRTTKNLSRQ